MSTVHLSTEPANLPPLEANHRYLMFLKRVGEARYQPIDGSGGVTAVSFETGQRTGDAERGLQHDIIAAIRKSDSASERKRLLGLLLQFRLLDSESTNALLALSQSQDKTELILSSAMLVRMSNNVEQNLAILLKSLNDYDAPYSDELNIVATIVENNAAQAKVLDLERLADAKSSLLRQTAMLSIKEVGSDSEIPFYVKHLHSSDSYVQYMSVLGLAEATRKYGDYAPDVASFHQDPSKYLTEWEQWARSQGIAEQP